MRDMAQLRLQDEVSRLEGSLTGGAMKDDIPRRRERALLPPYIVPDGPALCEHLNIIRQLAATARFIIIIPVDGMCALDTSNITRVFVMKTLESLRSCSTPVVVSCVQLQHHRVPRRTHTYVTHHTTPAAAVPASDDHPGSVKTGGGALLGDRSPPTGSTGRILSEGIKGKVPKWGLEWSPKT